MGQAQGLWRAEHERGGYRIKTIENYRETLMEYDPQGNLLKKHPTPCVSNAVMD